MTTLTKICRQCQASFTVDEQDQAYYARVGVTAPTLCQDHRQRRRLSFRNERNLYHRKCDLCEKQIISMYRAESPFKVYCNICWWSDKWDPASFGKDFDFSRPFFEQMKELQLQVPRLALFQKNNENCEYTNHTENNRNCYLCVDTAECEDVFYSKWSIANQNCSDCYYVEHSQLVYEGQYLLGDYNSYYLYYSDHNTDCAFLVNCYNCSNCFMCTNLERKQYCVRNKQLTKTEYEQFMATVDLGSFKQLKPLVQEYERLIKTGVKRALILLCENCTGDCVYQCKNVRNSFDMCYSQDCRYCYEGYYLKDCYDTYESAFNSELQYECHGCNRGVNVKFANVSYDVSDCEYIDTCHNSSYLFACVGVKRGKYCILNKQYTKEAYEDLRSQIIAHMRKTNEWGEFFPAALTPFAYNETIAQEYFPLDSSAAQQLGYLWLNESHDYDYQGPFLSLPDHIKDCDESITKAILKCEVSGKLYKIIPQEFALYKNLGLALPRRAPQQRYLDRLHLRSPRKIWPQICTQCQKSIEVPFEKGENVYCNECFNKMIYA